MWKEEKEVDKLSSKLDCSLQHAMHVHTSTLTTPHHPHACTTQPAHTSIRTTTHTSSATSPVYTRPIHVHPTVGTSKNFNAPTSLAAIIPTTLTEQQILSLIKTLFHENDLLCKQVSDENHSLCRQIGELTTKLNVVMAQLASLTSTPQHHRNPARSWHEETRTTRKGAIDSRSAPTHAYDLLQLLWFLRCDLIRIAIRPSHSMSVHNSFASSLLGRHLVGGGSSKGKHVVHDPWAYRGLSFTQRQWNGMCLPVPHTCKLWQHLISYVAKQH